MKLSIVLLTWNATPYIRNCLDALLPQVPEQTEIIVIDNGSRDNSAQIIRQEYPDVILIVNQTNIGVGPARNQGLRLAKGNYILILDIDTIVQPGAIHALLDSMDHDPSAGLAAAKLVDPDGNLQYTCRHFPTAWGKLGRQLPAMFQNDWLKDEELRAWDHRSSRYVGYVIGACQLIRRQAMEQIGLYDEHIFYGPEDVDYCLRMWQAGWRVLYNPQAVITHFERRITRKSPWRNPLFWIHLKGVLWYFWKHKYLFRPPCFAEINRVNPQRSCG